MNRTKIEDIYELSPLQQGMLFHCLYTPEAALYFEQVTLTVHAPLNSVAFDRAWSDLIARNSILRTSFHWEGLEKPLQVVHRDVTPEIQHLDLSRSAATVRTSTIEEFLKADRARGIDLAEAPLIRIALIHTGSAMCQFVLSFHHIILDGWSLPLLFRDFSELYDAYGRGRSPHLESRRPFGDYIGWLQLQDLKAAEQFWSSMLSGYLGPSPLRIERNDGYLPAGDAEYSDESVTLPSDFGAALQAFARTSSAYSQHSNTSCVGFPTWPLLGRMRYCLRGDCLGASA